MFAVQMYSNQTDPSESLFAGSGPHCQPDTPATRTSDCDTHGDAICCFSPSSLAFGWQEKKEIYIHIHANPRRSGPLVASLQTGPVSHLPLPPLGTENSRKIKTLKNSEVSPQWLRRMRQHSPNCCMCASASWTEETCLVFFVGGSTVCSTRRHLSCPEVQPASQPSCLPACLSQRGYYWPRCTVFFLSSRFKVQTHVSNE